uniref:Fetuin beta n=1 Tax=Jaculus jaculus TaxID=51337 RepID=A0A8C5KU05_JACJA
MGALGPLGLCVLAACCAQSPGPSPLRPRGCNDSDVLAVAGFALDSINRDRRDGYVLSLNRVHDAREHHQENLGSLFYLTLDVLETDCHVLSKKAWKDCRVRNLHDSVYGQCKAMFLLNKPRRVLHSLAYNCTLRPVSRRKIHRMCPDCPSPSPIDLSDPSVLEAATQSLEKYNSESPSKQYSLVKITRASNQWVVGPAYFVEYLITESTCTKSQGSSCLLQLSNSVPVGLCIGSLTRGPIEKFVTVTCDFFESQDQNPGGENSAVETLPGMEEVPQGKTAPTNAPSQTPPRGSVQYLPDLDDNKPEDGRETDPQEAFPVKLDLTTDPQGEALDVSFLFLGPEEQRLLVLPFPGEGQRSAECPGPAQESSPLVLPP